MSNIKKFRIKSLKIRTLFLNQTRSHKYGKRLILDNLTLELNNGQIMGFQVQWSGKTTIFNIITGLVSPDFGSIYINSEDVKKYPIYKRALKYKIGFVPQHGGYFHNLTVNDNLRAIAEIVIEDKNLRTEKINSLISKFELDPIRDIRANNLSGGQKKKLVISLALLSDPKILLLDEPFAALDVMTIKLLQNIIVDLQYNNQISIILCDHQARDLLACVDNGAIIQNGKVIVKDTPTNLIKNIEAQKVYFGDSFKIS